MPRNYKKEYANYQGRPDQKKKRAMRNKARRIAERCIKALIDLLEEIVIQVKLSSRSFLFSFSLTFF